MESLIKIDEFFFRVVRLLMSNDLGNGPRWDNEPKCQNEAKGSLYRLGGARISGEPRNRKYNRLHFKLTVL